MSITEYGITYTGSVVTGYDGTFTVNPVIQNTVGVLIETITI